MLDNSSVPGTDLVDRAAKETTTLASDIIHHASLFCAFQVINKMFCDEQPPNAQTNEIYHHRKISIDLKHLESRRDYALIARLHSFIYF